MATVISTTDYYMNILSGLSNIEKLDLINKLSASISFSNKKTKKSKQLELLKSFKGDWGGDEPVVEYAESLRNDIPSERTADTW